MTIEHIAIVGFGSIGARHLRLLRALRPNLEITLIRSGMGSRTTDKDLANNIVSSIEQAIGLGVQAAIIASPSSYHLSQSTEFLNARIPLLIEKPISNNMIGLSEFLSLAEVSKVPVLIGYVLRHRLDALKFKSLVSSIEIGQISSVFIECASYLPEWRPGTDYLQSVSARRDLGGGVLLELSHELDYMNWFFGECRCVDSIVRNTGLIGVDVEDQAIMSFVNKENILISTVLDFARRVPSRRCTVISEKGQLRWDLLSKSITSNFDGVESNIEFSLEYDEPYLAQLQHFFRCVEEGERARVDIFDGAQVMNLLDEIRELSKSFVEAKT